VSDESFTVAFLGSKVLREEQRGRRRTTTAAAAAPHLSPHGAPPLWPRLPLLLRGVGQGAV
jgi:hypothetical protein